MHAKRFDLWRSVDVSTLYDFGERRLGWCAICSIWRANTSPASSSSTRSTRSAHREVKTSPNRQDVSRQNSSFRCRVCGFVCLLAVAVPNCSPNCSFEAEGQEDQVMGSADPLRFGAEVRNCIWHSCQTGVKVMAMTTCLNTLETMCLHSRIQRNEDIMTCCELSHDPGFPVLRLGTVCQLGHLAILLAAAAWQLNCCSAQCILSSPVISIYSSIQSTSRL